jgi:hypothetical protein
MRNGIREEAARQNNFAGALEQAARRLAEGAPVESRPAWRRVQKVETSSRSRRDEGFGKRKPPKR